METAGTGQTAGSKGPWTDVPAANRNPVIVGSLRFVFALYVSSFSLFPCTLFSSFFLKKKTHPHAVIYLDRHSPAFHCSHGLISVMQSGFIAVSTVLHCFQLLAIN